MRIGLLTSAVSRSGGGVFEAVVAQAMLLRAIGHEPVVLGLADEHSASDRGRLDGIEVATVREVRLGPVALATGLTRLLIDARLDLLHLHGIWQPMSWAATRWARRTGGAYMISPHGMLDPWILARGRLKKWIGRLAYERASWARATMFHALTQAEADDIRAATGRSSIVVIPNAVAAPPPDAGQDADGTDPFMLYLSRIHPKKNVEMLVDAWCAARIGERGYRLVICGWGEEAHVASLTTRIAASGDPSIVFEGSVFGDRKQQLLRGARFVVLPSQSEGLPMAILEAWAAGTPTLMSRACHLDEGFAAGAAIDCGMTREHVEAALTRAVTTGQTDHAVMQTAAYGLATGVFSVEAIGGSWNAAYEELVERSR